MPYQNIADRQSLSLNVPLPVKRLSASLIKVRVGVHIISPPWRFPP